MHIRMQQSGAGGSPHVAACPLCTENVGELAGQEIGILIFEERGSFDLQHLFLLYRIKTLVW